MANALGFKSCLMKYIKIAVKYLAVALLLPVLAAAISSLSYRAYKQKKTAANTAITVPAGIDSLERVSLGGVDQWILARGRNKSNPVLLFLHGGPGFPDMPFAHRFDTLLEKDFVVVHWDQRGAGKSYDPNIDPSSMTVGQFISDTRELTEKLKRRFNVSKIYLAGHSWGSIVGVLTVRRYPGLYEAYIGIGQEVNITEADKISYRFVLERAVSTGNKKALRELEEIGPPPYTAGKVYIQRKWLNEFGGVFYKDMNYSKLFNIGIVSPEYSL